MDDALRDDIERAAEIHALLNAIKHEGEADVGAIMGPLMGENPAFRPHGDRVPGIVAPIVAAVNDLASSAQRERLGELAPEKLAEFEQPDDSDDDPLLPDLPNVEDAETVRMRLAPNPNGPWHLGNARMCAVIGTYKALYDGWMLCRFDDTDPETKRPDLDAYDAILESISYLGFEPDEIIRASDRMDLYYDHARELIKKGGAYTCSLPAAEFSELKRVGTPSPSRSKDPDTVIEEFEAMIAGDYEPGEMVLRVKTDMDHKNPALRDWVAFRQVATPHPRAVAAQYRCWPLLDFQSGIDDHLMNITHIIRGIDLQDSAKRQQFLYDYFDWEYPEVLHWGHVQIDEYDVSMSTSTIKALVESGDLEGWDDPRAPTIASLRRRGIRGEAIVNAMVDLGTSTSNVDLAMSSIYAYNRDIIDETTDRFFFVRDGMRLPLVGDLPETATPPRHPTNEERGTRTIPIDDAVLIESDDLPDHGDRVWLKGLGCVRLMRDAFELTGDSIDAVREENVSVSHWVPAETSVATTLHRPEGSESGDAEPAVATVSQDTVVQFERVGFARIEQATEEEINAMFAHR